MKFSSLHNVRQTIGARLVSLLLGVLAILIAAGILVTFARVGRAITAERQELIKAVQALADHIDHELEGHIYNVMAMRNLAESYLSGYLHRSGNPADRLRFMPEQDGYASSPPGGGEGHLADGRMVGIGPVPAPDSSVIEEMRMAESLTPLMRAIRDRSPDTPWVYYTSAQAFIYLFPAEEAEDFFFTPKMLEMEFLTGATPQANPSHKFFWTKPYLDEAGKGLMATVSYPIYQAAQFKGSVSIDVSVKNLQYIIDMHPLANINIALVSEDGQQLAHRAQKAPLDEAGGDERHRLSLKLAPWHIDVTLDEYHILREALKDQASHIVGEVMLVATLSFSALLARYSHRVRTLSIRDGLTGLYNRRFFDEIGPRQFDAARRGMVRLGMISADVDYFKKYNDTYGHQQGDMVLKGVAKALEQSLLRGTDLVFRLGGEEFCLLVFMQDQDTLHPILAKLNHAVRDMKMPHEGNPPGYVTISLGAVIIDKQGWLNVDAAYQRVDEALYQAKSRGRDCYVLLEPAPPR